MPLVCIFISERFRLQTGLLAIPSRFSGAARGWPDGHKDLERIQSALKTLSEARERLLVKKSKKGLRGGQTNAGGRKISEAIKRGGTTKDAGKSTDVGSRQKTWKFGEAIGERKVQHTQSRQESEQPTSLGALSGQPG